MVKPIKLLALLLTLTLLAVFVLTNVRDRLNDVLLSEKHLLSGYGTGCNELICQQLISLVKYLPDTHLDQTSCLEHYYALSLEHQHFD